MNRRRHKRLSKNFAARIGDRSMATCAGMATFGVGKIVSVDFKRHSDALPNELAEQLRAEMQVQVDILTYKFRATAFAVVWNCSIITLVRPPCTWAVEARKQSEAWNIRRYSLTKSSNGQDNEGFGNLCCGGRAARCYSNLSLSLVASCHR